MQISKKENKNAACGDIEVRAMFQSYISIYDCKTYNIVFIIVIEGTPYEDADMAFVVGKSDVKKCW